jgi:hypothetical protein
MERHPLAQPILSLALDSSSLPMESAFPLK